MKALRKVLLIIVLTFVLFASSLSIVSADTVTNDAGNYNYTTTNEEVRSLASGVEAIVNNGYTTRGKTNYDQRVNIFTAETSKNADVKIATWAIQNDSKTGYTRKALLDIAKDYEEKNPGWIVLAGINADQYYQKTGTGLGTDGSTLMQPQPYYPMISNGENLFIVTPYGNSNNYVGFKNDGSTEPFQHVTSANRGLYIEVYDETSGETKSFPVDGLNCELGEKKTVVYSGYKQDANNNALVTRTSENDIYIVEEADLSYVSSIEAWKSWNPHALDAFFGKGEISKIEKSITFDKVDNTFAIETTNEELLGLLKVGSYVTVEVKPGEEMDNIEEAIGWHTIQRINGADNNVDNSYNTRAYPRSVFGCDENGKIFLMTCFGDNSSPTKGLYAQEFNALMKKYGVVEAYQMDGGGSVTSIVRDEDGILGYAEACVEASHSGTLKYSEYRYILSGLFIVMKVPEVKIEVNEIRQTSALLNVNTSKIKGAYDYAVIRVTEPGTEFVQNYRLDLTKDENLVPVNELDSNKTYNYELFVQTIGNDEQKTFINGSFNTYKLAPTILGIKAQEVEGGVKVTLQYDDPDKALVKLAGKFGNRELSFTFMNGTATLTVKNNYNVLDMKVFGDCVLDATSSKHQDVEMELTNVEYPVVLYFDYTIDNISNMISGLMK